jgi:tape measure domain-containing protein
MEGLRWSFDLRDRVSGPARRSTKALRDTRKALRDLQRDVDVFDRRGAGAGRFALDIRGVQRSTRTAARGMDGFGTNVLAAVGGALALASVLQRVASVVADIVVGVGRIVAGFAQGVIEAGAFSSRLEFSLEHVTGSRDQAHQIISEARELADLLGTSRQETMGAISDLMVRGFSQGEATTIFQGLADLQTLSPEPVDVSRIVLAMGQIRNAGHLQGDELRQLQESGLPLDAVREAMARRMGVEVGELNDLQRAGRIDADTAITSILEGIQTRGGGGPLGSLRQEFSNTLPGLFERLQHAPANFFDEIASRGMSSFGALREVVAGLVELLDPTSETFQNAVDILGLGFEIIIELLRTTWEIGRAVFEGLFGEIASDGDPLETIRKGLIEFRTWLVELRSSENLQTFQTIAMWVVRIGEFLWPVVRGLGVLVLAVVALGAVLTAITLGPFLLVGGLIVAALGFAADAIARLIGALPGLWATFTATIGQFALSAVQWGRDIVDGLVRGVRERLASVAQVAGSIGTTVRSTVASVLDMHSPSQVMRELGEMTGAGFALGLGDSMPDITPSLGVDAPSLSRGGINVGGVHIEMHIASGDPQSIEDSVRRILLPQLEAAFEGLALEDGTA